MGLGVDSKLRTIGLGGKGQERVCFDIELRRYETELVVHNQLHE